MRTESRRSRNFSIFSRKWDFACAILLMVCCVFIFKGVILGGHLLFGSDFVAFYQGMKQFLFDEIHNHHSIPFWNPYVFGGMPFWAHLESTIFYPLDFLFWVMAPERAFGYTMFIHMVLAALFMYTLLRSLNTSHGGSFVGATAFICNGFIMATLYDGQMFRVQAYVWLPLVIWLLNRSLKPGKSYLNAVMAGLFWGFQILSGSPQDALYTLMAAVLFCLLLNPYEGPKAAAIGKLFRTLILFIAFGLGTASIQMIPALEFIRLSVRSVFDTYDLVTMGSYPPQGIITTVIPDFFGRYAKGDFWVSNVPWSIPLYNLYVGILPLVLLAFIFFRNRRDRKVVFFAGALAVGAFLLALGANTPIYRLIYLLPGFDRIRAPAKIIYLYVFALSLLAGKGMDGLFSLPRKSILKRTWIVLSLALSLVVLDGIFQWDKSLIFRFLAPFVLNEIIPAKTAHATRIIGNEFHIIALLWISISLIILLSVRNLINKKVAVLLLCALMFFDLAYMNWGALRYDDKGYEWASKTKKSLAQSLGRDKGIFRVGSYPNSMGPNFEMYLGFQTVAGYNPLYLYRYFQYIRKYNPSLLVPGNVRFFYTRNGKKVLMDLMNVKYEISHRKGTYAFRSSFLPRVFFIPTYEVLNRSEILDKLINSGFEPKEKIFFETEDSPDLSQETGTVSKRVFSEATAEVVSYSPDKIVAMVNAPKAGFLFFSEVYYPGWKAYVDGNSVPILRGDYIFRVVQISHGKHAVTLAFKSMTIRWGTGITLLTLLLIAILLACHFEVLNFRKYKKRWYPFMT